MCWKKLCLCVCVLVCSVIPLNADELILENINFALDSETAVDDLLQMDRLSKFINSDSELLLEITGHTDSTGNYKYNQELSLKRSMAVKKLLVAKGIQGSRIFVTGQSSSAAIASNDDVDGRLLNRRASFDIFKLKDGQRDYYYKDNKFIKALEKAVVADSYTPVTAVAPTQEPLETAAAPVDPTPALDSINKRLDSMESLLVENNNRPLVSPADSKPAFNGSMDLINNNLGKVSVGLGVLDDDFRGAIDGSFFIPFNNRTFAFQTGFNGSATEELKELQMDAGIVTKIGLFQLGLFGSTKFIKFDDYGKTGNLSQVGIAASRSFGNGSIGLFATQGIKDEDVVDSENQYDFTDLVTTETYLSLSDKYGVSFDYQFKNDLMILGSLGGIDAEDADFFGQLRLEYPITDIKGLRVFVQTDYNSSFLENDDVFGAMAGISFSGNCQVNKKRSDSIQPMTVQGISYEIKTRTTRVATNTNSAPDVTIQASKVKGTYPLTVDFKAFANDPDGTIVSHEWDFGDGNQASGETVSNTFVDAGYYNVTLIVTDNKGVSSTAHVSIEAVNEMPEVQIQASRTTGSYPLAVSFTAIASDPDGTIVSYEWDFGDGDQATGETADHTFVNAGVFNVTLKVTDNSGVSSIATIAVEAINQPPQAYFLSSSSHVFSPALYTFQAVASDLEGSIVSYEWDFGNGNTGSGANVTQTYDAPGGYIVSLTVTDEQGATFTVQEEIGILSFP